MAINKLIQRIIATFIIIIFIAGAFNSPVKPAFGATSGTPKMSPATPSGINPVVVNSFSSPGGQIDGLHDGGRLNAQDSIGRNSTALQDASTLVFDSFTGAPGLGYSNANPSTYMGDPFDVANPGGAFQLTDVDFYMVSATDQSYSNGLCLGIQFWENYVGNQNPVFSTPVGFIQSFSIPGPVTLQANTYYTITGTFSTPLQFANSTNNGFAVNYQGDIGSGCADTNNLTSLIRYIDEPNQLPISTGSIPLTGPDLGYYRNGSGLTNFNFSNNDLWVFTGTNSDAVAIKLYGNVISSSPGSFYKSLPANGATGLSTSPALSWSSSSNATSYEYCIDTSANNTCDLPATWTSTGSTTGVALNGLIAGTTYSWQVRARNSNGLTEADNGNWWSFTTSPLPSLPGPFSKIMPANGVTSLSTSLALGWGSSSNATSYEFCIDTSANNTCDLPATWTSTGSATGVALNGLIAGTTYSWQVRARNASGLTEADNGNWWSFTTSPLPSLPGPFNKIAPSNGATGLSTSLTLSWGSSSNATSYEYCVDTSANNTCDLPATWTSTGSATGVGLNGLIAGTTYSWQVHARNATGLTEADNGNWWGFTTSPLTSLPGPFSKTAPANGASGLYNNPTLSWGSSSNATSYEFCIDTSANNTCDLPATWTNAGINNSATLSNLALGTTYSWQIRAKNAGGTTNADGGIWGSFSTASTLSLYLPIVNQLPQLPAQLFSMGDSDIISGLPDRNTGMSDDMWVGYHKSSCFQSQNSLGASRGLVRFDLASIPAGTAITKATLTLQLVGYCYNTALAGSTVNVSTYRASAGWDERAVTWNTKPSQAELLGSFGIKLDGNALKSYSVDVTSLVKGWINGSYPNFGLILRSNESSSSNVLFLFATREWSTYAPYLTLTYSGQTMTVPLMNETSGPAAGACRDGDNGERTCSLEGNPTKIGWGSRQVYRSGRNLVKVSGLTVIHKLDPASNGFYRGQGKCASIWITVRGG